MEKLKVGNKLYHTYHSRWNSDVRYDFATVDRLTKTQAILSNGIKLINEPIKGHYDKEVGYGVYGERYDKWYFENPEVLLEAKKEKERQKIDIWFSAKKFTDEEKEMIYNLLKDTETQKSDTQ